jgi:hypothetical protein
MNTPKSFKPYHGCFGRFQGHLGISANFNPEERNEVVGKKGKKMKSKWFARSVALGPSNTEAGTNLRSAHAVPMSHVMSGSNQVRLPSTGFIYSGPGVKRTASIGNGGKNSPKINFVKLVNRKQKVKQEQWKRVQRNKKRSFTELSKWLDQSSK